MNNRRIGKIAVTDKKSKKDQCIKHYREYRNAKRIRKELA